MNNIISNKYGIKTYQLHELFSPCFVDETAFVGKLHAFDHPEELFIMVENGVWNTELNIFYDDPKLEFKIDRFVDLEIKVKEKTQEKQ